MSAEAPATFGSFDFDLSAEQEARAARLHRESIVIDLLYWGPVTYRAWTEPMLDEVASANPDSWLESATAIVRRQLRDMALDPGSVYREHWDTSGVTAGSRSTSLAAPAPTFGAHVAQFDRLPWLVKALRADDFRRAKTEGKHAGFLNTQQVGDLTLDLLEASYDLGLRMLMPTYNNLNHLAAGCTERTDSGISNFGAVVIKRMNALGMILDTSHLGHQSTLDCCQLSSSPVIASHTCASAIYHHHRAKTDEELQALAATGGVVGILAIPFFLTEDSPATIETTLDHLDYVVSLIGWEHVAIGTDWPMMFPKSYLRRYLSPAGLDRIGFRPEHNVRPEENLVGFDDYRDFPNITRGLVKRDYDDEQIRGILGENFLRVFERVCG